MPLRLTMLALTALLLAPLTSVPAAADETGFASMHDLRREAGRLCMTDHWHTGNGSGRSKKAARYDAIRSWSDFTDLEYGRSWASFRHARGKGIRCQRSGKGYDCSVQARPCRRR
jgi:hypothetical protein